MTKGRGFSRLFPLRRQIIQDMPALQLVQPLQIIQD